MESGFKVSEKIPARPGEIYTAWLSSSGHSAMTGSRAQVDGSVGGKFSAWDGYISGTTLDLTPNQRIIQAWRTTEFPDEAPDSHLEIILEEGQGGTMLTLIHTDLPQDQIESYRQGWEDFYFKPMKDYFSGKQTKT